MQRDVEDLVDGGKFLTEEDRAILTVRVEEYFASANRLEGCPGTVITTRDAMNFQAHILLHLLNDNIIPVPRSEIFCHLQLGTTFDWDMSRQQFFIEFKGGAPAEKTKTRVATKMWIPSDASMKFRAWLKFFRPVLVSQTLSTDHKALASSISSAAASSSTPEVAIDRPWAHSYLFVKKDGSGPRHEILNAIVGLQRFYLQGRAATPHRFRSMQATDSAEAGISTEEHRAMCAGRQHTTAAAERFYVKHNRKRNADIAALHLQRLRKSKQMRPALERSTDADDIDGTHGLPLPKVMTATLAELAGFDE